MRKFVFGAVAITVVLVPAVVMTQGAKTKPTTAIYITKEEVDIVNHEGQGTDRNIKVVDIGHENFTVGIIHRGKTVNGVMVPADRSGLTCGSLEARDRSDEPSRSSYGARGPRSSLTGSIMIPRTTSSAPSTATPTIRNGSKR